jgi:hypothetical protein
LVNYQKILILFVFKRCFSFFLFSLLSLLFTFFLLISSSSLHPLPFTSTLILITQVWGSELREIGKEISKTHIIAPECEAARWLPKAIGKTYDLHSAFLRKQNGGLYFAVKKGFVLFCFVLCFFVVRGCIVYYCDV